MTKIVKNNKGFSLLELLVALAILAVGMLGLLGMQISGIQGNAISQKLTIAASLAQTGMEDYMARSSDEAVFAAGVGTNDGDPTNDPTYDLDPNTAATDLTYQGITYSATYFIILNDPVTGVARISVTVTEEGGRSVTFTSFKRTI